MTLAQDLGKIGDALGGKPLAGFRNAIINGNFDIWQRGTSFTSTSVNEYSADRFRSEGFSLSTTISRQSFASNQTDVPGYPTYYCRVATSATVSGGQYWAFQQRVEAPQNLSGYEQVTLSFWARATSGTIVANTFSYGGSSGRLSNPTLTTTWQKLTHTWIGSGPASGYVEVYLIYLAAGTSAISVDIAQVQLEAGPVATPFERRPIGTELALCQRYYQQYQDPPARGVASSTTGIARVGFSLPVIMRVAPTGSLSGTIRWFDGTGTNPISAFSATYSTPHSFEFDATTAGTGTYRPIIIYIGGNTGTINLSAEL